MSEYHSYQLRFFTEAPFSCSINIKKNLQVRWFDLLQPFAFASMKLTSLTIFLRVAGHHQMCCHPPSRCIAYDYSVAASSMRLERDSVARTPSQVLRWKSVGLTASPCLRTWNASNPHLPRLLLSQQYRRVTCIYCIPRCKQTDGSEPCSLLAPRLLITTTPNI